jgi:hypothetical protein
MFQVKLFFSKNLFLRVFCSYFVELLVGEGSMSVIMQKTRWKATVVVLPLRQFHYQNNPTVSFSLAPTGP